MGNIIGFLFHENGLGTILFEEKGPGEHVYREKVYENKELQEIADLFLKGKIKEYVECETVMDDQDIHFQCRKVDKVWNVSINAMDETVDFKRTDEEFKEIFEKLQNKSIFRN